MLALVPGLHIADWVVLAVYFAAVLVIGIWTSRRIRDAADFFTGGRHFGGALMTFFAFGSGTSGDQSIAAAAGTWKTGPAGIWWQLICLPVIPFFWLIAPVLRRIRAVTTADFFGARFSPAVAILYSCYGILFSIVFIATTLFSSGKMINALSGNELDEMAQSVSVSVPTIALVSPVKAAPGTPAADVPRGRVFTLGSRKLQGYEFVIVAMTVLFVIYGMTGGLSAAITTDVVQGTLTIAVSILLLPLVFYQVGGFAALQSYGAPEPALLTIAAGDMATQAGKEPITVFYGCVLSLTALAGIIVQPHIMGVCGAGRTEYECRLGFTAGNLVKQLCTSAWMFTAFACVAWYLGANGPLATSSDPADRELYAAVQMRVGGNSQTLPEQQEKKIVSGNSQPGDELFARAAHSVLPQIMPGLAGLLIASLLASMMSSSDTQMIFASGLFTENIYKRHITPGQSDNHYLWVSRLAGLLIVLAALVLQATFEDVIHAMKIVVMTPAAIGISMWFGIFWRRWNAMAVWVSTSCAAIAWGLAAFQPDTLQQFLPEYMFRQTDTGCVMFGSWQSLFYLSVGVIAGVITSLTTWPQPAQQLDNFFTLVRTPVQIGEINRTPCTVPEFNSLRDHVIEFAEFQFPRPTKLGIGGFVIAWICVFALAGFINFLGSYL